MNWPTCCCRVMGVQASKCVGPLSRLVGFDFFLAVSDQLVPEFGNRFYTHDSVTKVIQEMACRVVPVFGIKTGIRTSLFGLSSFQSHVIFECKGTVL